MVQHEVEEQEDRQSDDSFHRYHHFCGLHFVDVVGKVETISNNTVAIPLFL